MSLQQLLRMPRHLRAAQPDVRLRTQKGKLLRQLQNHLEIPYIAGKSQNIRFSLIEIHQDMLWLMIDRILGNLRLLSVLGGIRPETEYCQIRVDVLGIDRRKDHFHMVSSCAFPFSSIPGCPYTCRFSPTSACPYTCRFSPASTRPYTCRFSPASACRLCRSRY